MSSKARQQLESWIKDKKVHGDVLDIGGSQLPVKNRIQYDPLTTKFYILDLPIPHKEKEAPDICMDIQEELPDIIRDAVVRDYGESFDYVTCLEVSEYWFKPLEALKNIHWFLKKGGTLFISFHFLYPVHSPVNQDYLRYTRTGAVKLLEQAGFEIVKIVSREVSEDWLTEMVNYEGMKPARGYEFHDETGVLIEARKK